MGRTEKVTLPLIPFLQRADLYTLELADHPRAILILCPGVNGNGRDWLEDTRWQQFARQQHLDLAAISFASDGAGLRQGHGYYYASEGSGQLLLDGLNVSFPAHLPLLVFGFSGGAQFTSRFVEWDGTRVLGWCAYSADWWDRPQRHAASPCGLVVCGEDDPRYGASLTYFKQGRAMGDPWLWVSVPHAGHVIDRSAETFIRSYFASLLDKTVSNRNPEWVDIDFKTPASDDLVREHPSLTGWLPNRGLLDQWKTLHHP